MLSNYNKFILLLYNTSYCKTFKTIFYKSFLFQDKQLSSSEDQDKSARGQKRHQPITFGNGDDKESPEKRSRSGDRNMKMYTPPSGKYSSRLNNSGRFSGPNPGRGRGGYGRRDFRNNGAPFRRRNNY